MLMEEPRAFYDITSDEDLGELCNYLRSGIEVDSAILMPEDLPEVVERLKQLGRCMGYEPSVDGSEWPRSIKLVLGNKHLLFRKVEEGVYKIVKPR